ncbi:MAG: phage holin family protein [Acidobacteria bacterium]|nr:phage holin family protein [Acidobacteriota bacterium]
MEQLLFNWLFSALSLLIAAHLVPGFQVSGFFAALIAAVAVGLVNSTIGLVLKILTFPLTLLTLGIFWLVINALILEMASWLVPGFEISGFFSAFLGAIILSLVNLLVRFLFS